MSLNLCTEFRVREIVAEMLATRCPELTLPSDLRARRNITENELARMAQVKGSTIRALELGQTRMHKPTLARIAAALNVDFGVYWRACSVARQARRATPVLDGIPTDVKGRPEDGAKKAG